MTVGIVSTERPKGRFFVPYYIHTKRNEPMLTLTELQDAHPAGVYFADHGCFYFLDYDGELGYFIEYTNGDFEKDANWVDLDTLADDEREECLRVAATIATNY